MLDKQLLVEKASLHLNKLSVEIPNRCVGSVGNRAATAYVESCFAASGWQTSRQEFSCIDWIVGDAHLHTSNGTTFGVLPGPYAPGCDVRGPLIACESVEAIEAVTEHGAILLLRGDVAREPLFPRNFPFVVLDEHQRVYRAVEAARPVAVVGATARSPDTAGVIYPLPLFEDGDFDIPSLYLTEEEGAVCLAACAGQIAAVTIEAQRTPAVGWNPVATTGDPQGKEIVVFAHIDTKRGTPGALDNAAGVVTLLLLADLLANRVRNLKVELVALNGEDHYSAIGEITWLQSRAGLERVVLGINVDGAGYFDADTAWSLYVCPPEIEEMTAGVFALAGDLEPGQPWYQSDHGLFVQNGVPALAITSAALPQVLATVFHTAKDTPAIVDVGKLVTVALALRDLVLELDSSRR